MSNNTTVLIIIMACAVVFMLNKQSSRRPSIDVLQQTTVEEYRSNPEAHYQKNKMRIVVDDYKECNDIDKRCYAVAKEFSPDTHKEASELLAHSNMFTIKLLRHLRRKYLYNGEGSAYKQQIVTRLLHNYNPDNYVENNPPTDENTSYVEDKGAVFGVCLREKISGRHEFHSTHLIEFVVLHEIAHLASISYDHKDEFWTNFKILLEEAQAIGLHEPVDYQKSPVNYCSLIVDYNPYFDRTIKTDI